jgi:hypothetical protein
MRTGANSRLFSARPNQCLARLPASRHNAVQRKQPCGQGPPLEDGHVPPLGHTQKPRLQHIPDLLPFKEQHWSRRQHGAVASFPQLKVGATHVAAPTRRTPMPATAAVTNARPMTRTAFRRGIGVARMRAMLSMSSSISLFLAGLWFPQPHAPARASKRRTGRSRSQRRPPEKAVKSRAIICRR